MHSFGPFGLHIVFVTIAARESLRTTSTLDVHLATSQRFWCECSRIRRILETAESQTCPD